MENNSKASLSFNSRSLVFAGLALTNAFFAGANFAIGNYGDAAAMIITSSLTNALCYREFTKNHSPS